VTKLWTAKHAPRSLKEIAGNEEAKEAIAKWALEWQRGKAQKPLLVSGPTGIGKTALAHCLAEEMGWSLVETNASDLRDAENLKKLLGFASSSQGLFGEKRLLLVDEVDAAFDRGEVPALSKIIENAEQPVLIIANDVWNPSLSALRNACVRVEMKRVNQYALRAVLKKISEAEGAAGEVNAIAENAEGDLRAAITDLQAGALGARDREQDVFKSVSRVFKADNFRDALRAGDNAAVDFDLLLRWIEENIPAEYEDNGEIAQAFDWLSRADVFQGRRLKRQYHSLLRYVRALSLGGVAASKKQKYRKFTRYQFPSIIRQLGASKANRALLKSSAAKVGSKTHCSIARAKKILPFLANAPGAGDYFGLSEEEASFLVGLYELERNRSEKK